MNNDIKNRIARYKRRLRKKCFSKDKDYEVDHCNADSILCNLLEELGYKQVVNVYNEVSKMV